MTGPAVVANRNATSRAGILGRVTARGPQPLRRPRAFAVVLAVAVALSLLPAASAGPVLAGPSGASPTAGLPIHGAGSDAGALVTPTDTVARMALAQTTGPASCTAWASETAPPSTIHVYRTRTDTVETLDFRAYVRKVVTGEFARTWPFQLLAIGAIAAKQNAWYWAMHGRDWTNLLNWGGQPNPIQKVLLPSGQYQWQTTAGSPSGAGLCWDITDNPGLDQCYDCGTTPVDPSTAPRNQAAVDATWAITVKRPRGGVESFFAPGYAGRAASTCPSMATVADWETWFTGNIDFNQAYVCATSQGESAAMLLRRFMSSALEIHDSGRSDLTGDGLGDVPVLRVGTDAQGSPDLALEPGTADPAYLPTLATAPPPYLGPDPGATIARAVGRLDRPDRASLVSMSIDQAQMVSITARSLDGPGIIRTTPWWTGPIVGLDPTSAISLTVADITGDTRPDVIALERARTVGPDGSTATWSLRVWVLATTDSGPDPSGFVKWADLGPFPTPTRFERLGDVDGDGRVDLVFAPGDGAPFMVARAMRNGAPALEPPEPYGSLVSPAVPADWRFFALTDGHGTGRDEPAVVATGNTAVAMGGPSGGVAVLNAADGSDPTTYAFTLAPLVLTWAGADPSLGEGLMWAGDVGGDGRSELGIVNASVSTGPLLLTGTPSPLLAIMQVRDGGMPPSIPTLGPGTLADVRVVAPGDQAPLPAQITVSPSAAAITWGSPVTFTLKFARAGSSRAVELQATRDNTTWTTIAIPTTNASGVATFAYRPATNLWYRAVYTPTAFDNLAAGTSPVKRVVVRQIALLRPHADSTRTVALGTTVTFTTTVRPIGATIPPAKVTYSIYRKVLGAWRLLTTRTAVIDPTGVARLAWKFTARGDYSIRAMAQPTPYNANSVLSQAELYRVP